MQLQILTPEEIIYQGNIQEITLPGKDGFFQILNLHAPMVSTLANGVIKIKATETKKLNPKINQKGEMLEYTINSGILELNNNKIIILCD